MATKRVITGIATSDVGDGLIEVRMHFGVRKRTLAVWRQAGVMLLIVLLVWMHLPGVAEVVRYLGQVR